MFRNSVISRRPGTAVVERTTMADPRVEQAWRALQDDGHIDSPFLSWEWFSALRDCPQLAARVTVFLHHSRGRIAGLLPVEIGRRGQLRVLGMPGWEWARGDHLDVVAAPPDRAPAAAAILAELAARDGWDVLNLDGLSAGSALAGACRQAFRAPRHVRLPVQELPIRYVSLRGEVISAHARKKVRQDLRRATASGGGFSVITEPARIQPLLDELMDMHVARFGDRSPAFATPERRRFHQLAAQRLGAAGHVRMHRLGHGDRAAAINYTLTWRDTLCFYSSGMREGVGRNPGFTLRATAMTAAAEAGLATADLLRGAHEHKARFAGEIRSDECVRVVRVGVRAAVAAVTGSWRGTEN